MSYNTFIATAAGSTMYNDSAGTAGWGQPFCGQSGYKQPWDLASIQKNIDPAITTAALNFAYPNGSASNYQGYIAGPTTYHTNWINLLKSKPKYILLCFGQNNSGDTYGANLKACIDQALGGFYYTKDENGAGVKHTVGGSQSTVLICSVIPQRTPPAASCKPMPSSGVVVDPSTVSQGLATTAQTVVNDLQNGGSKAYPTDPSISASVYKDNLIYVDTFTALTEFFKKPTSNSADDASYVDGCYQWVSTWVENNIDANLVHFTASGAVYIAQQVALALSSDITQYLNDSSNIASNFAQSS